MNPILDAFLASFITGITYTSWSILLVIGAVFLYVILTQEDDDDDDGGTLQPVYEGNR